MRMKKSKYAYIIPVYIPCDNEDNLNYFEQTLESIHNQISDQCLLIVIDDNSNNSGIKNLIDKKFSSSDNLYYKKNDSNLGPGISRNIGIDIADNLGCTVVMFQDSDDIANPLRYEKTKELFDKKNIDVVYSSFIPIDENGETISTDNLSYSIKDILIANEKYKLFGRNVWKQIATKTGYINITSSTSVKIEYAKKFRFPSSRSSEDAYTWMLYSAAGAVFYFAEDIPCKYRIPNNVNGSSSRSYVGRECFYKELSVTNERAFWECMKYAEENNELKPVEREELISGFYKRLIKTLEGEGMFKIAEVFASKIKNIEYDR